MFGYKLVRTKDYNRLLDQHRKLSILWDWITNSSHRKLAYSIRDLVNGYITIELTDMLITTYNDLKIIEKENKKKQTELKLHESNRGKEIQDNMKKRSYIDDLASKKMCEDYSSLDSTPYYSSFFYSGASHCDTSSQCD